MKFSTTLLVLCVILAVAHGKHNTRSNKSDKSSKNKSKDTKTTTTTQSSAVSTFLRGFKKIIDILISGNANDVAQSVCDGVVGAFGIGDTMDCYCNATLVDGFNDLEGNLECTSKEFSTCIDNVILANNGTIDEADPCGVVYFDASLWGGLDTEVAGYVDTCLGVNTPENLGFYSVCIEANFTMTGLDGCKAYANGQECVCAACDNDFSILYDCSGVDVSPFPGFPVNGPKIDTCQQLNFQQSQL